MLLNFSMSTNTSDNWQQLPSLDTFLGYEKMQLYFEQGSLHNGRNINNPTDDSYLAAFNQYSSHPEPSNPGIHPRSKREQRQLPSTPRMLRFELSDAVEPNNELKQLLGQYRDKSVNISTDTTEVSKSKENISPKKKKTVISHRTRRSTNQQPTNFKVEMIPFDASDAREPDAITAKLISRARALDIQRKSVLVKHPLRQTTPPKTSDQSAKLTIHKATRLKRSATLHLVKFELADAKTSFPEPLKRSSKHLPTMEKLMPINYNKTEDDAMKETITNDNLVMSGENIAETKRLFVLKDAPLVTHTKSKKSITLPHEVHKVIANLIKNSHGGKAYVKHLNPQNSNFENLNGKTISYVHKPSVKFVHSKSVEPVQVHIQPIPVLEQLRYVYNPSFGKVFPFTTTINQPIVVPETASTFGEAKKLHHVFTAQLAASQGDAEIATEPVHYQVPSKSYPSEKELEKSNTLYEIPIDQHNYEAEAEPEQLIKIEYHGPVEKFNNHYKQIPEFRELSTLIGKSPDDQIHGLTYLLAKEMQNKLRSHPVKFHDRPQDNTAPIQFHPRELSSQPPRINTPGILDHGALGVQPGRLIGMAKTKQYVPIVEPGNNDVADQPLVSSSVLTKLPTPNSFIDLKAGHGLSNGYDGAHDEQPLTTVEQVIHHSTIPAQGDTVKSNLNYAHNPNSKALHYASKYDFGYRIRDFHTGNDFSHKQNRDAHGVTRGQYHILLPDGRVQNVIYHADDTGFHADVSFESGKSGH